MLIAFGGLDLLGKTWIDPAYFELTKSVAAQTGDQFDNDDEDEEVSTDPKELLVVRENLVKRLNSTPDVTVRGDLLPDEADSADFMMHNFPPILFSLRIPHTLQSYSKRFLRKAQTVEDFHVILDGELVVYAVEVDVHKPYSGWVLIDVRERLNELLKDDFRPRIISPNVSEGLVLSTNNDRGRAMSKVMMMPVQEETDWKQALAEVYSFFSDPLKAFYMNSKLLKRAIEIVVKIGKDQNALLKDLGTLLSTPGSGCWHDGKSPLSCNEEL